MRSIAGTRNRSQSRRARYSLQLTREQYLEQASRTLCGIKSSINGSHPLPYFLGFAQEAMPRRYYVEADADGNIDFARFTDEGNLKVAYDHLRRSGGWAAGNDGIRLEEFTKREVFAALRIARDLLRNGSYIPHAPRLHRIPKKSGGYRCLHISNVIDRCVTKAIQLGYRRFWQSRLPLLRRDTWEVMAALHTAINAGYTWIAIDDIQTCYDTVPVAEVLALQERYIPNQQIVDLIRRIVLLDRNESSSGICQGCPYSSVLVEAFLNHQLDPTRISEDDSVILRYVDNLICLGRSARSCEELIRGCEIALEGSRMRLRDHGENRVVKITTLDKDILGFNVLVNKQGMQLQIPSSAKEDLFERLNTVSMGANPETRATRLLQGFLSYYACVTGREVSRITREIRKTTKYLSLHGINWEEVEEIMENGRNRWNGIINRSLNVPTPDNPV